MNARLGTMLGAALLATPAIAQPFNDSCGTPEAQTGYGVFGFDSTGATTDGVDNAACDFFGGVSIFDDIWYCWTAQASELALVQTCGSGFDTKIAVYDGCTCPEGSGILACNDDSCGLQSVVTFNAVAGQTYLIRVGGFSAGDQGAGIIEFRSGLPEVLAGPFTNPVTGREYFLLEPSSWTAAEAKAVSLGGHLATVRDADENEFIRASVAGFDGNDRRVWLGLNDFKSEGSFVWTSGEPVVFTNWSGGEPNDFGGAEDAVEMFGSNGLWNDNADTPGGLSVHGCVEISGKPECRADFNNDDAVNSQDFFDFLTAFFATDPSADFNNDTLVNSQDFFDFLTAFFEGC
jgi:hypothetical protein